VLNSIHTFTFRKIVDTGKKEKNIEVNESEAQYNNKDNVEDVSVCGKMLFGKDRKTT